MLARLAVISLALVLLTPLACLAGAETWIIGGTPTNPVVWMTFDNTRTSINTTYLRSDIYENGQWVGYESHEILFSGRWAAAGVSTDPEAPTALDPYATFVIEGNGSGHIQWAPGTPPGYRAPLSVGFQSYSDGQWGMVMDQYTRVYRGSTDVVGYCLRHTFYADYVPEPGSIVALLAGLAGLAWRRRRQPFGVRRSS